MSTATLESAVLAASTEEVLESICKARDSHQPIRIAGAGSWLDAGAPVREASLLSVSPLRGVVEYVPGDFTLTALAGTTLEEIARVTQPERQWLALDPHGSAEGTLGATIATASAGALAGAFGTPREQVLGLEAVSGSALRVSAGGRVVKNVAGFDLTRLFTGSWGTLGVITQVSVRLRAMPETDRTVALLVPATTLGLTDLLAAVARAGVEMAAAELLNDRAAAACGITGHAGSVLMVRLIGNESVTASQVRELRNLTDVMEVDASVWDRLRRIEPARAAVYRLSRAPALLASLYAGVVQALAVEPEALFHATVERGVVRVVIPLHDDRPHQAAIDALRMIQATIITERAPEQDRISRRAHSIAETSGAREALAERVRKAFDPDCILNPGILAGSPK